VKLPPRLSRPNVGLRPNRPQNETGARIEPLVSEPGDRATMPAATAVPLPPEEHAAVLRQILAHRVDQAQRLLKSHIEISKAEVKKITLHSTLSPFPRWMQSGSYWIDGRNQARTEQKQGGEHKIRVRSEKTQNSLRYPWRVGATVPQDGATPQHIPCGGTAVLFCRCQSALPPMQTHTARSAAV
jgi:hypothetical protein